MLWRGTGGKDLSMNITEAKAGADWWLWRWTEEIRLEIETYKQNQQPQHMKSDEKMRIKVWGSRGGGEKEILAIGTYFQL